MGKEKVVNKEITGELEEPLRMLALTKENLLIVEALSKEIEAKISQLKVSSSVPGSPANKYPLNGFKKVGYPIASHARRPL